MDFLLVLVEIMTVNNRCDIFNRVPDGNTSSFAIRNLQVVERALRKVTCFTRSLSRVCNPVRVTMVSRRKLKASIYIVEGRPCIRYSIVIACVYTQTSIHRAAFYILRTKGLA